MDEVEILLTIAEIGVALAGFASLATILGRRYKPGDRLVNAVRLRGLLDAGLSTMLLALIGVLMLKIGGPSRWVWQAVGIAGVIFAVSIGTAAYRREKLRRHLPGFRKVISAVMFVLVAVSLAGFLFIGAGFGGDYGFHIFLAILCLLLVICCTMFVLVIASLMASEYGQDPEADV